MTYVIHKDPHPSVVKQAICRGCGCTFGYVPNEVFHHKCNYDYLGEYDTVLAVKCPLCQRPQQVS